MMSDRTHAANRNSTGSPCVVYLNENQRKHYSYAWIYKVLYGGLFHGWEQSHHKVAKQSEEPPGHNYTWPRNHIIFYYILLHFSFHFIKFHFIKLLLTNCKLSRGLWKFEGVGPALKLFLAFSGL